jgi:bifunctional DNA-binding transcriptional regulator/antitoxin component of YhaV-PrlF toxin-antitoxin module
MVTRTRQVKPKAIARPQTQRGRPPNPVVRCGVSTMTSKGQVTVTASLRKALGLKPRDRVLMTLQEDGTVKLQRIKSLQEVFDSAPKVPPIDWKAFQEEIQEEVAEKIGRQLYPESSD